MVTCPVPVRLYPCLENWKPIIHFTLRKQSFGGSAISLSPFRLSRWLCLPHIIHHTLYYYSLIRTDHIQISICSKSKPLTSIHVFAQNEYSMAFQFEFKVKAQMIRRIHAVQIYMLYLNSECISFIKLESKLIQWILIAGFCAIQTHSSWMFNHSFSKRFWKQQWKLSQSVSQIAQRQNINSQIKENHTVCIPFFFFSWTGSQIR